MSEGKRTPGPFYQAGHVILRRGPQGEEPKGVYPCDETVDLLNKGTHYDGMLEALKAIRNAANERSGDFQADIDGLVAAWVLVDDAITAAAGGKEKGAG